MTTATSQATIAELTLVTDRSEGLRAHEALARTFASGAEMFRDHVVGWQGGRVSTEVFWRGDAQIWGVFLLAAPRRQKSNRPFLDVLWGWGP